MVARSNLVHILPTSLIGVTYRCLKLRDLLGHCQGLLHPVEGNDLHTLIENAVEIVTTERMMMMGGL